VVELDSSATGLGAQSCDILDVTPGRQHGYVGDSTPG
jgi:hypothetical protein